MKKGLLLSVVICLLLFSAEFALGALNDYIAEVKGDTLVIKDYSDMGQVAGSLREAIMADNVAVPAGRVYELKSNGYYPLSTNLTTPTDRSVIIVGADDTRLVQNADANSAPPVICGFGDNTGGISFANDLTVKNASIIPAADRAIYGWCFFSAAAPNKTLRLENCLFEHTRWVMIESYDVPGTNVYINDCYFVNLSGQPCHRNGGVYDNVGHNTATMWVENSTHVMDQGWIYRFRNFQVGKIVFNHNTFVNISGYVFETLGYQSDMLVVNNIFVNCNLQPYMPGLDEDESDADHLPRGIINVNTLPDGYTDMPRKILVDKNVIYWDPKFADMVQICKNNQVNGTTDWHDQMITMNTRTQAMFDDDTNYPYLIEGTWYEKCPTFTDSKDLLTYGVDSIKAFSIGTIDTNSWDILPVWRKVFTNLDNDYIYSDWPIPVDLAYSDADLLIGGINGFPVGDLNWFPTQKAAWKDQKDDEYALIESRLENLSTIQIEVPNISSLPGDTLLIPINVQFPVGHTFSSAEFTISGYIDKLEFIDLVGIKNSTPSIIGVYGWSYEINETDEALYIALYGSEEIFGDGVLFWIKYAVPDTATKGFIPIIIEKAVFNTGEITVNISSGGVYVTASFGDVDLNGKIQAYDASLILKYLVDYIDLSIPQLINAEVSGNGFVTAYDASLIAQYVVKLINRFPVETNPFTESASGNISMENKVVKPGDLIEVPLVLSNGNNILSFEGSITYNPQYLTFDSLNWSELVDGFSIEINANPGEIKFAGAGSVSDGGEGIFSTIKFKASENFVETVVALKKLRWNENDMLIDVDSTILSKFVDINEDQHNVPKEYALDQNYPNPFNPTTTISYQLPKSSFVKLYVYDVNGRLVETLVNEQKNAGYYSIIWNAKNVSSGVYLYRIDAGDFSNINKCIFIK